VTGKSQIKILFYSKIQNPTTEMQISVPNLIIKYDSQTTPNVNLISRIRRQTWRFWYDLCQKHILHFIVRSFYILSKQCATTENEPHNVSRLW